MPVLLVSADLLFASRLAGAAERLAVTLETAANAQSALDRCAAGPVKLVLLDLTLPGLDVATLVAQLRAAEHAPRAIVAYGPHVHEAKLQAAEQAHCDAVLTRGQFNAQMEEVLSRWAIG